MLICLFTGLMWVRGDWLPLCIDYLGGLTGAAFWVCDYRLCCGECCVFLVDFLLPGFVCRVLVWFLLRYYDCVFRLLDVF